MYKNKFVIKTIHQLCIYIHVVTSHCCSNIIFFSSFQTNEPARFIFNIVFLLGYIFLKIVIQWFDRKENKSIISRCFFIFDRKHWVGFEIQNEADPEVYALELHMNLLNSHLFLDINSSQIPKFTNEVQFQVILWNTLGGSEKG